MDSVRIPQDAPLGKARVTLRMTGDLLFPMPTRTTVLAVTN